MWDNLALCALAAVVREGSFERAARVLHVTPSAVSQRIRGLEERLGRVLLIRSQPVRTTAEGARLYRHYLQVEMLESDLNQDLLPLADEGTPDRRRVPIAVNADSLATWVVPALVSFHASTGHTVTLQVDDQDHTRDWLRQGTVFGAVTAEAEPVSGCRVDALGPMRYVAAASPAFAQQHLAGQPLAQALGRAPMLVFNQKDRLQHRFMASVLGEPPSAPPVWWIPSSHGFLDAAVAGLGWGLHPKVLVEPLVRSGALVDLFPGQSVAVPLYWQSWRLNSATVTDLRRSMLEAAAQVLEPVAGVAA